MQFSVRAHSNRGKLIVVHKGRFCVAYAEHAVPLAHSTLYREKDTTRSIGFELADGMNEMTAIGPEFDQVASMKLGFGINEYQAFTHLCNTANKHTAIVRTSIAHDLVAALALQVSRGKSARESLGKGVHLFFACAKLWSIGCNNGIDAVTGNSRFNAIDNRTVHSHNSLYIFRRFHAALDFQRSHTCL